MSKVYGEVIMNVSNKHWTEFDKIGINRDLVSEQECGIWLKNLGCHFLVTDEQKEKLVELNTKIQCE